MLLSKAGGTNRKVLYPSQLLTLSSHRKDERKYLNKSQYGKYVLSKSKRGFKLFICSMNLINVKILIRLFGKL